AFAPAVHETDPEAKVIYGGQADPSSDFTRRALGTCQCASEIDVYAYHTYPGYGQNMNPESMDYGAYGDESPSKLREFVRNYPGIAAPVKGSIPGLRLPVARRESHRRLLARGAQPAGQRLSAAHRQPDHQEHRH